MFKQLKIGDEVFFSNCRDGRADHGAYCIVDKINRRSIKCIERKGSYKAGKLWTVGAEVEIALISYDGKTQYTDKAKRMSWGVLKDNGVVQ